MIEYDDEEWRDVPYLEARQIYLRAERIQKLRNILERRKCKASVVARILKLNPAGLVEGCRLRGVHPRPNIWADDVVTPSQFIREHGRETYYATDRRWWKWRGCKKAMSRINYEDNVWKYAYSKEPFQYSQQRKLIP